MDKKAAEWNPEPSSRYRTNRTIGRPKKRWEDDTNDFLKQILTKERLRNHLKERIKTIAPVSILPVTGKNGLDLKKNTQ